MTPEENFKESDESRSIIEDTPKDESLDNKDTRSLEVNAVEALDRKSTRLNSSHIQKSRMPSSA